MRTRAVSPRQSPGHGQGSGRRKGLQSERSCPLPSNLCPGGSFLLHYAALPRKNNFIQILEGHPVNQNTAGCQHSLSRTVLSHTMALSILLLHSLDRDINKKRKRAITVTKALTAQGKWHVNSSSGRLKLAGNHFAPRSV